MLTIYKYHINEGIIEQNIKMPETAKILKVGLDPKGVPSIWAVVDTDTPPKERTLYVVPTGDNLKYYFAPEENVIYLDTIQIDKFIWHIFIKREEE